MRGTWQTTDGGDTWQKGVIIVAVVATLAAAGPVAAAAASLIEAVLIAVAAVVVLAAAGIVALVVYRVRRPALPAPRPMLHTRPVPEAGELRTGPRAVDGPREVHLHFHAMDPEAVAAALRDARISE